MARCKKDKASYDALKKYTEYLSWAESKVAVLCGLAHDNVGLPVLRNAFERVVDARDDATTDILSHPGEQKPRAFTNHAA